MMTIKEINKEIRNIAEAGKTMDSRIQLTTIGMMEHAQMHGDRTAFDRMLAAFPKSGRKQAWIKYVEDHTPYNHDAKGDFFTLPKKNVRSFFIEDAKDCPFWEYTTEKKPEPLNIAKTLAAIFKAMEEGKEVIHANELLTKEMGEIAKKLWEADKQTKKNASKVVA
jgi:hypothetical protein